MVLVFQGHSEWGNGPLAEFILFYIEPAAVSIAYVVL
jgi:hypothetical protein